jgi:hypothetical protein
MFEGTEERLRGKPLKGSYRLYEGNTSAAFSLTVESTINTLMNNNMGYMIVY